jgi:lipopolysaccharide assembly outer membrane protein LptD (OstA)
MQHEHEPFANELSTGQCWWLVCLLLFFLAPFQLFAQTDSLSRADSVTVSPDTLTIASDTLGLGEDFRSKVVYHATDSIVYDLDSNRVLLYGNAEITYEDINLKADFIEINYDTKILSANGLPDSSGNLAGFPEFKQGTEEFKSKTLRYNFDTKKGRISDITTQEGESFVHGTTVKKEADNTTYIRHGFYTTCELEHPHYFIAASKIKVIPDNKIVSGPANLVIADVPTPIAIPFGFFPNRKGRTSGILFPAYGESAQLGFFLQNGGYYFGFSDYFDLALTGDIYTRGSWRLNGFSNYANRYHYGGNLSVNYSYTKTSIPELPDYAIEKGFFIRWNHRQDPKARPNSNFSASVNAGSSAFYRNNITSAQNYLTNTFQSSVAYSKSWPGKPYNFSASLSHTQNTNTRDISISLPSANFSVTRREPFRRKLRTGSARWYEKIGVSYNSTFLNTISTKDTLLFREESLNQLRYGLQHSVPVNTSFTLAKYFTVSPSVSYTERWYLKSIRKEFIPEQNAVNIDTVSGFKAAREFSTGAALNTRIYGMLQFTKGKLAAIRHVMIPTLNYTWRPDFSTSGWGAYKDVQTDSLGTTSSYSIFEGSVFGGPGSGEVSSLSFSLDNILEMKVRQQTDTAEVMKKVKILESLSAAMSYNFAADSMNLSFLSVAGRTTLFERLGINFNGTFDPYVVNEQGIRINTTELDANGKLLRFTTGNIGANVSLTQRKKDYSSNKGTTQELNEINRNKADYLDYSVPFNLSVGYNLFYQNNVTLPDQVTQTLNFTGDVQMTPNWKVTFNSGYDFEQKDISYTSLGILRDLHCWEMRLNWVPFGFQQNYFFQINVKSSILQDLKLTKRTDRFDQR